MKSALSANRRYGSKRFWALPAPCAELDEVGQVHRRGPPVADDGEQLLREQVAGKHRAQVLDDTGVGAAAADVERLDDDEGEQAARRHGRDPPDVVVELADERVDLAAERRASDIVAVVGGDGSPQLFDAQFRGVHSHPPARRLT